MQQIRLSFRELNEFISGFQQEFVEFGTLHKKQKIDTVSKLFLEIFIAK